MGLTGRARCLLGTRAAPEPPRKHIHLPQDFFQLTFQCLRFVQTITALGSTSNPNLFSLPTFSPHRPHRRRPVRCPAPAPRSAAAHTRHAATRRKRRRLPRTAPPPAPAPRALLPAPPPPAFACCAATSSPPPPMKKLHDVRRSTFQIQHFNILCF